MRRKTSWRVVFRWADGNASSVQESTTIDETGEVEMKQPRNPFHPGEIRREEFLEPGNVTQTALAAKLGWTRARLNELVRGKREISAEAALDLADALGERFGDVARL